MSESSYVYTRNSALRVSLTCRFLNHHEVSKGTVVSRVLRASKGVPALPNIWIFECGSVSLFLGSDMSYGTDFYNRGII